MTQDVNELGLAETAEGLRSRPPSASLGLLIFGFGCAAGLLLAFSGLGVLEDSAGLILFVFLTALMFIGAFGLMIFLFRRPLLRRLFGFAEAQVELFAQPLARVARSAMDRNAEGAVQAARDVIHLALARYAWLSTRRWIIGSMTALIAAMAALAGTALLYKQNEHLEEQTGLMDQQTALLSGQNDRIDRQIAQIDAQLEQIERQITLEDYSVQLAEAARNAELAVEITAIAGELGRALDAAMAEMADALGQIERDAVSAVPVLDPLQDLDLGLLMRIGSASRATKPYRFLDVGVNAADETAKMQIAAMRRSDLPQTLALLSQNFDWRELTDGSSLIDRPQSPERGQLLIAMTAAGIRDFEVPSFFGLDLSFAYAQGLQLYLPSFQVGRLAYADLSHSEIREGDFGGADLANVRLRGALVRDTSFARVPEGAVKPPFDGNLGSYATTVSGMDLSGALVRGSSFAGVNGLAMNFDTAAVLATDFTEASIGLSTFRGAVLLDNTWDGADLRSVDFDGAIVAGADWLARTAEAAAPASFRTDRFELRPVEITEAFEVTALFLNVEVDEVRERVGNRGLYRVVRTQPFEN